jgi:hypothetical protein
LVISVTPFLVSLLFAYSRSTLGPGPLSSRLAVALYGGVQALGGLVLLGIWRHATHGRRLVRTRIPEAWIRATETNQLLTVAVFALSTAVAFASPLVAELTWIAMILGFGRNVLRWTPRPGSGPPTAHG